MKKGDIAAKVIGKRSRISCLGARLPKELIIHYPKGATVEKVRGTIGILVFPNKQIARRWLLMHCKFDNSKMQRYQIVNVRVSGRIIKPKRLLCSDALYQYRAVKSGWGRTLNFTTILRYLTSINNDVFSINFWDTPEGTYAVGRVEVLE